MSRKPSSYDSLMDANSGIEERVAARLSNRYRVDVSIDRVETLPSAGYVARFLISGGDPLPRSVIAKRVTDRRFDVDSSSTAPSRALNEIAASAFLTEMGAAVGPRLIDWDEADGLVIFEDLGPLPTLEQLLWEFGSENPKGGLLALAESLAVLHSAGRGLEDRFMSHQSQLGTVSPRSDSTVDQRPRIARFETSLRVVEAEMAPGFRRDLDQIETLTHDVCQFRSIIHADAGPQNFLYADGEGRLIDLEFVTAGNVFCDVAGPRLGFPQTMLAAKVPPAVVGEFEDVYLKAARAVFSDFADSRIFERGLVSGAGHWALNRWSSAWNETVPPEEGVREFLGSLARNHLVMDGLVSLTRELDLFHGLGETVASLMERVRGMTEVVEHPMYPAFQE